ncbi:MAG: hypothetical protein M1816_006536 [Peltula sp. TS41687]|nr:MAG: hypothetical protein M1816_006536 [Peltula sp. TS41687]
MARPGKNEEKKAVSLRREDSLIPHRHDPGRTLLPGPLASVVSLATKSSSISLQIGTFIARRVIDGARVTSLTSLDLTRAAVESILLSAGHDVISRTRGELGKAEAEGLLEQSMAFLHSGLTQAAFLVATGFHISSATVSFTSSLSQYLLTMLDSFLGSTESSRAIASIITLIRREIRNPVTGMRGERVGLMDLLVGTVGLALLQRWARKTTEKEMRERRAEEVIWDVIVLNNGKRADVVGVKDEHGKTSYRTSVAGRQTDGALTRRSSFISVTGETDILDVMWNDEDGPENTLETDIEHYVQEQLPSHANITVTRKTITTQTVVVEISGTVAPHIETPPGFVVVEKTASQGPKDAPRSRSSQDISMPDERKYRIVYQAVNSRPQKQIANKRSKPRFKESFETRAANHLITPMYDYSASLESAAVQLLPFSTPANDDRTQHMAQVEPQIDWSDELNKVRNIGLESPDIERYGQSEHGITMASLRKLANDERRSVPSTKSPEPVNGTTKSHSLMAKFSLARLVPGYRQNSSENLSKAGSVGRPLPITPDKDQVLASNASRKSSKDQEPFPAFRFENNGVDARAGPDRHMSTSWSNHISRSDRGQLDNASHLTSPEMNSKGWTLASPSRSTSYINHRGRSSSLISQTDSHSSGSPEETRPNSPILHMNSPPYNRLVRRPSEKEVSLPDQVSRTSQRIHRRSRSFVPSIYTLHSDPSETSLIPADSSNWKLPYDQRVVRGLFRTGRLTGSYPLTHLIKNVTRFVRFASASYGSHFLRVMGIASERRKLLEHDSTHHHEHQSFSNHARLSASTILLSSFVDPQGGTNSRGETDTGLPLVHFVSLDHQSKAVVLTCRGTLGFEDVLTDMVCEYDDLYWRGAPYKVHKGIHASARRLLRGNGSRVVATIQAAMEEFSDYGLVLCGHSLGAAVAALLAIMISEPASMDTSPSAFVTASMPPDSQSLASKLGDTSRLPPSSWLPSGRPVHVYAFGPPATVSPSLRLATRGLITTIINGQDIVPSLSLGVLNDMQAVALAFKTDPSNAKGEVRGRVWEGLLGGLNRGWHDQRAGIIDQEEDQWAYSALKSLRASMVSPKLLPPGNIFVVETQTVLQRDAFVSDHDDASASRYPRLGRPATRAILKYVRDVEGRFRELRFGGAMLSDHSPARYEISLAALSNGVLDD